MKNIVLAGFGHITLLDLDTIDLSNLNRQFLFRKKDIKQSKALVCTPSLAFQCHSSHHIVYQVAARTAQAFNPNVRITPIHGNIKEPQFDVTWFKSFDIVLNALDNLGECSSHRTPHTPGSNHTQPQMLVDMSTKCAWLLTYRSSSLVLQGTWGKFSRFSRCVCRLYGVFIYT